MNVINGNILDIKEGIVAHQVNCKGVAGAGLAKQIRIKWPEWYLDYKIASRKAKLGAVGVFTATKEPELIVANLYSQFGYGRDKQHTDYNAFRQCLEAVRIHYGDKQVHLPYRIGAGNGGGLWQVISGIIEDVLPSAIIVKLEG